MGTGLVKWLWKLSSRPSTRAFGAAQDERVLESRPAFEGIALSSIATSGSEFTEFSFRQFPVDATAWMIRARIVTPLTPASGAHFTHDRRSEPLRGPVQ